MSWKGFGKKWSLPNSGSIRAFAWKGRGDQRKLLFITAGVPVDIRIQDFPNPSTERYRYTSLFHWIRQSEKFGKQRETSG
jgi:hypothetical protein